MSGVATEHGSQMAQQSALLNQPVIVMGMGVGDKRRGALLPDAHLKRNGTLMDADLALISAAGLVL